MKPKHFFFFMFLLCLFGLFHGCSRKCENQKQKEKHYYSGTQIYFSYPDSAIKPVKLTHINKGITILEANYSLSSGIPISIAMEESEKVDLTCDEMEITIYPLVAYAHLAAVIVNQVTLTDEESNDTTTCTSGQIRLYRGRLLSLEGSTIEGVAVYDGRRTNIRANINDRGEYEIELEIDADCMGILGVLYRDNPVVELRVKDINEVEVDVHLDDTQEKIIGVRERLQEIMTTRDLK